MSMNVSGIESAFRSKFSESGQLYKRGLATFPSGVTHDGRYLEPFPIYVSEAKGSRKTTVEGHSFIDYWVGHGALLLGHSYPSVVEAVKRQMERGTHYSAATSSKSNGENEFSV